MENSLIYQLRYKLGVLRIGFEVRTSSSVLCGGIGGHQQSCISIVIVLIGFDGGVVEQVSQSLCRSYEHNRVKLGVRRARSVPIETNIFHFLVSYSHELSKVVAISRQEASFLSLRMSETYNLISFQANKV